VLSLEESDSGSPDRLDLCSSCASHVRPTRIGAGGNRSMLDPDIAYGSGSYKNRSPILLAMKRRDPKANLEFGKNFDAISNAIDLT
jgi:hypothetical protein